MEEIASPQSMQQGSVDLSDPAAVRVALERGYSIFIHYNRQRLYMLKRLCPEARHALLQTIPLFFQINDRRAPGYVADLGSSVGIHAFKLTDEVRDLRKNYVSSRFVTSVGTTDKSLIECIATIGSAGTLAQTEKSDFDFWIVLRSDIGKLKYKLVEQKAKLIKEWLLEQDPDLDLNFYMATPEDVKRHYFGEVSDDSAGSALGKLLKEEFYRTCIVWAGKMPFWWCIPSDVRSEEGYGHWLYAASQLELPFYDDLMDMGPIERPTPAQLLSAVLWQTNKSLGSPFKSLMKLTVVNRYHSDGFAEFLAERVRRNVQVNPTHGRSTDPYLCLFEYCVEFWVQQRQPDAVKLMCEMFFVKQFTESSERFSVNAGDELLFRRKAEIRNVLDSWGLTRKDMRELSAMSNWSFKKGMEYRHRTQHFVKEVFDRVLDTVKQLGIRFEQGRVIKMRDDVDEEAVRILSQFSCISDKVDCFYARSATKPEPIPPSFRSMLHQRGYAVIADSMLKRRSRWRLQEEVPLFAQEKDHEKSAPEDGYTEATRQQNLIEGSNVLALLAWLAANQLAKPRTLFRLIVDGQSRAVAFMRVVLTRMEELFHHPLYEDALPEAAFKDPPKPIKMVLGIDLHDHPAFKFKGDESKADRSDSSLRFRSDAFIEHPETFTICEQNSYGIIRVHEVTERFLDVGAVLARCLRVVRGLTGKQPLDSVLSVFCNDTRPHEAYRDLFLETLERLISLERAVPRHPGICARIVTKMGGRYILILRRGDQPLIGASYQSVRDLLVAMERSEGMPVQTVIDPQADGLERMREMLKLWRPGVVRIFFKKGAVVSSLHVLDESGCVFHERVDSAIVHMAATGLVCFFRNRMAHLGIKLQSGGITPNLEVFEISHRTGIESQFDYAFTRMNDRTITTLDLPANYLRVAIVGKLDLRSPHRVTFRSVNGEDNMMLEGQNLIADLAAGIHQAIKRHNCWDFALVDLHDPTLPKLQPSIEALKLRRALDHNIRRLMMQRSHETQVRVAPSRNRADNDLPANVDNALSQPKAEA